MTEMKELEPNAYYRKWCVDGDSCIEECVVVGESKIGFQYIVIPPPFMVGATQLLVPKRDVYPMTNSNRNCVADIHTIENRIARLHRQRARAIKQMDTGDISY